MTPNWFLIQNSEIIIPKGKSTWIDLMELIPNCEQVAIASGDSKYMERVREAQKEIDIPNVVCVDAKGLPLKEDHLHLTTEAQVRLGQMLADAYLANFAPPPASSWFFKGEFNLSFLSCLLTKLSSSCSFTTFRIIIFLGMWVLCVNYIPWGFVPFLIIEELVLEFGIIEKLLQT